MIGLDKIAHAIMGAILCALGTVVLNPVAGLVLALLVGCAKEWVWDAWLGKGQFDPFDLLATVSGGAVFVAAFYTFGAMTHG